MLTCYILCVVCCVCANRQECDHIQGWSFSVDGLGGLGGLACALAAEARDQCRSTTIRSPSSPRSHFVSPRPCTHENRCVRVILKISHRSPSLSHPIHPFLFGLSCQDLPFYGIHAKSRPFFFNFSIKPTFSHVSSHLSTFSHFPFCSL